MGENSVSLVSFCQAGVSFGRVLKDGGIEDVVVGKKMANAFMLMDGKAIVERPDEAFECALNGFMEEIAVSFSRGAFEGVERSDMEVVASGTYRRRRG